MYLIHMKNVRWFYSFEILDWLTF